MTIETTGETDDYSIKQTEVFEVTDKGVELVRTVIKVHHKSCIGCVNVARSWYFEGAKTCAYIEPQHWDEDLSIIENFVEFMLTIDEWC